MNDVAGLQNDIQAATRVADHAGLIQGERGRGERYARILSLAVLAVMLTLMARGAAAAYHAMTDSLVAPITLSPESDTVLQNRLSLNRLLSEQQELSASISEGLADVEAIQDSLKLLQGLQASSFDSLGWAREMVGEKYSHGRTNMDMLRRQREELQSTVLRQQAYLADLERSVAAGLVRRVELERERTALNQAQVALLQNGREQAAAGTEERTTSLARQALRAGTGRTVSTPEMQAQRELLTRVGVELLRFRADLSGRQAHLRADRESLARVDDLVAQMKARPTIRAIEASQNLAFATYKEIEGIRAGAGVYRCPLWGLFGCSRVGTVSELVPGEVAAVDSWGSADRGQYVLLNLTEPSAAQARTLRIRAGGADQRGQAQQVSLR